MEIIGHRTVSHGGFPRLPVQKVAKAPPGAYVHVDPPVNPLQHAQCERGAKVAKDREMTGLHYPWAHDQWHVNANRLVVQQASRSPHRARRVKRRRRCRITEVTGRCVLALPSTPCIVRLGGLLQTQATLLGRFNVSHSLVLDKPLGLVHTPTDEELNACKPAKQQHHHLFPIRAHAFKGM